MADNQRMALEEAQEMAAKRVARSFEEAQEMAAKLDLKPGRRVPVRPHGLWQRIKGWFGK